MINQISDPYEGKPAEFVFRAKDQRGDIGEFDYYKAANGMLFIGNPPHDLEKFYEGGFQPIPGSPAELDTVSSSEKYKIDQLRQFISGGDYLEIGPWIGMAAYNAKKAGFHVTTLEMNARCVDLMQRAGINAIRTDDPTASLAQMTASFDAIAMWHSIEHVPAPWRLLELAAERLKPGGILLVAAPNPESAQARVLGRRWFHLDAPRHLHLLPIRMVREIGERKGLELVELTTDDQLGIQLDRQGWEWPFWRHIPPARRKGLFKLPIAAARRIMTRLYRRRQHDGAAYTMIFRRPD